MSVKIPGLIILINDISFFRVMVCSMYRLYLQLPGLVRTWP